MGMLLIDQISSVGISLFAIVPLILGASCRIRVCSSFLNEGSVPLMFTAIKVNSISELEFAHFGNVPVMNCKFVFFARVSKGADEL